MRPCRPGAPPGPGAQQSPGRPPADAAGASGATRLARADPRARRRGDGRRARGSEFWAGARVRRQARPRARGRSGLRWRAPQGGLRHEGVAAESAGPEGHACDGGPASINETSQARAVLRMQRMPRAVCYARRKPSMRFVPHRQHHIRCCMMRQVVLTCRGSAYLKVDAMLCIIQIASYHTTPLP